jgi:hypothetical protein
LLSTDNEGCLAWLADARQQLRQEEGQTKGVSYLEAVSEEVLFEMKATPSVVTTVRKTSRGHGKRVPILALGERGIERNPDRRDQPRVVRALRVAGKAARG